MMIFKEIVYQILFFLYLWTYKKEGTHETKPTITIHYRIGYPKGSR